MIPEYNKVHNKFKLNGINHDFEALKEVAYSFIKEGQSYEIEIGNFLLDWLDEKDFIEAKTSGSTGIPKDIKIKKQAMVNSAIATGDFFKLKPSDTALLCLPVNYIAGKMMLIRALVLGLELDSVEPKSKLSFNTEKMYQFVAMVPMQLESNIKSINNIKTLIVGGAQVSNALIKKIQNLKTKVYETYGMTETVSHIAVKALNHSKKKYFKTLPNIKISQDSRDCLIIEAPQINEEKIITNDIVKLHSKTEFEWLGRFDNVINSGGIKIFPEQVEVKLQEKIKERFFIASEKNETLGEAVILIIESKKNTFKSSFLKGLEAFEKPKAIYYVEAFIETTSGKIQRTKTLELIKK